MKMRFLVLMTAIAFSSTFAQAEDKAKVTTPPASQQSEQCLETQNCSLQLNLELLKEMHARSGTLLANVMQKCQNEAGPECLDREKIGEWLALNEKSKGVMESIDSSTALAEQSGHKGK